MNTEDFISGAEFFNSADARQNPGLTRYSLEGFASEIDAVIQSELLTKLILSHSEIACRLETVVATLRRSEAALKEAQQVALLGHWDIDYASNTGVWSDSIYDILEADRSEPPSMELFLSRVQPQARAEHLELFNSLMRKQASMSVRVCLQMPDGREKIGQIRLQTEFSPSGKPIRGYGTLQDVTAMAKAEEELENYNKRLQQMVKQKVDELTQAQMATIYALVKLSESRDDDTGAHIERTASFCRLLAEKARAHPAYSGQIDDEFLDSIYKASPLHDIGKVGITDAILLKPAKLTPQEFEVMKTHVEIGYQTLLRISQRFAGNSFLKMGLDITRCHHEKWDGSGYQRGLKGEEIPLSARIMAVSDVYDALRSRRVYKEAYSHETSLAILTASSGSHFDPTLIELFRANDAEFAALYDRLSTAQV